jgi:hypothetical protein
MRSLPLAFRFVASCSFAILAPSRTLAHQPIFYSVLNIEYAIQIARDWNAKYNDPPEGYVTRFDVRSDFLSRYEVRQVGAQHHLEYWIPAEDLEEFNANIVGLIEVVEEYGGTTATPDQDKES